MVSIRVMWRSRNEYGIAIEIVNEIIEMLKSRGLTVRKSKVFPLRNGEDGGGRVYILAYISFFG